MRGRLPVGGRTAVGGPSGAHRRAAGGGVILRRCRHALEPGRRGEGRWEEWRHGPEVAGRLGEGDDQGDIAGVSDARTGEREGGRGARGTRGAEREGRRGEVRGRGRDRGGTLGMAEGMDREGAEDGGGRCRVGEGEDEGEKRGGLRRAGSGCGGQWRGGGHLGGEA